MPLPTYRKDICALLDQWAKSQDNQIDIAAATTALILFGVEVIEAAGEPELGIAVIVGIIEHWADGRLADFAGPFWKKVASGNLADRHRDVPTFDQLFPRHKHAPP